MMLKCGKCVGLHQYCARAKHEGPCVVPRELPDDAFEALPLIDDVLAARGLRHVGYVEKGGKVRPVDPADDVRAVLVDIIEEHPAATSTPFATQYADAILSDPRIQVTLTGWQAMTGGAR